MFYRRKVILALIQLLNGEVEKLRLQKLLFLCAMGSQTPQYDFVPYKYGCYSFSAQADLNTMVKKGFLKENDHLYQKNDPTDYFCLLKTEDRSLLQKTLNTYGEMDNKGLIRHTYINFPFYAINSTIVSEVLSSQLYARVENATPARSDTILFTLGYEGVSLEKYLRKLIENNVRLLIDVRKNPISMKFGFSKTLLNKYCQSLGIKYLHIPEVGIQSDKRKQLETRQDYEHLFNEYRATTLKNTLKSQNYIIELLAKHERIALTCFEADPNQCHRSHLADFICNNSSFNYPIKHL